MEKNLDRKNRWRNVVVAFRMSPEESDDLNNRVRVSGRTKQDYIISRLQERDIVVQGNPRIYKALRDQMEEIYQELKRLECGEEVTEELLLTVKLVAQTLGGLKED